MLRVFINIRYRTLKTQLSIIIRKGILVYMTFEMNSMAIFCKSFGKKMFSSQGLGVAMDLGRK